MGPPPVAPTPWVAPPGAPASVPPPGAWMGPPPHGGFANVPNGANGPATAALVVGIVALVFCFTVVGGIAAVVLGFLGLARARQRGGAGRGRAVAGLVLGLISVVLGVLTWLAVGAGFQLLGDALDGLVGPADPADYAVSVDTCDATGNGGAAATGSITNTSGRTRNFLVRVAFRDDGSVLDNAEDVVYSLDPGDEGTWTVDGSARAGSRLTCAVVAVENYLN